MDVHVFQHSLYYVDPATILAALGDDGVGLASVHHIFGATGVIKRQMAYYVARNGLVCATARGNAYPYVHPPNDWLKLGRYTDGRSTLTWTHVSEHLGSHVYVFRVVRGTFDLPARDLWSDPLATGDVSADFLRRFTGELPSVLKSRQVGPLHTDGSDLVHARSWRLTLKYGVAYAYHDGDQAVAVPVDLIGTLAARATGAPRDPTLVRSLFEAGKRLLATGAFPPDLLPDVLIVAVAAAVTRSLEREAATMGALHRTHGALIRAHSAALSGGAVEIWRWYYGFDPRTWWATCCVTDEHDTPDARSFHALVDGGIGPTVAGPVPLRGEVFGPVYRHKTSVLPGLALGASVTRLPGGFAKPPPDPNVRLSLISLGAFVPTTAEATEDAMVRALRIRICRETPPSNPDVWRGLFAMGAIGASPTLARLHVAGPITITPDVFEAWVSRWPANLAKLFRDAEAKRRRDGLSPEDLRVSAMLKVELSGMRTADGSPAIDERAVVAYKPIRISTTGPFDWQFAKVLRSRFAVVPGNPAVWVNGPSATAEAFGEWFDHALQSIRAAGLTAYIAVFDQNKFEAHRDSAAFHYTTDLHLKPGPTEDYKLARLGSIELRGKGQRLDVAYRAKFKLGSGGSETSVDSFERNISAQVHVFGEPREGDLYMAANGDDGLVVSATPLPDSIFHDRNLQCGFEADYYVTSSLAEVEFCQSLPYPVGGRTIWGPKIGRVLSRLPWSTSSSKSDPRGVAIGMLNACSHIPFLREYLQRVFELSPGVEPVEWKYHVSARERHDPQPDTWAFIQDRYGLTPADLGPFCDLLQATTDLGVAVHWPHLERLAKVDE